MVILQKFKGERRKMLYCKLNYRRFYGLTIIALLLISVFIAAFNVQPVGGQENWWNLSWQYRKMITINHNKVAANLTDFPVLINITDSDLDSKAQSDGDDIAFADYSGNKMYYGNPTASNQENVGGVWDSSFVMVHHLEETSSPHYDSTSNDNDGTAYGGLNQDAAGKIDGADDFDGTDDYVRIPNDSTLQFGEGSFTAEVWIKPATGTDNVRIVNNRGTGAGGLYKGWHLKIKKEGSKWKFDDCTIDDGLDFKMYQGTSTYSYDIWHHVVMVYEADSELRLYSDGNLDGTLAVGSFGSITNSLPTAIGAAVAHNGVEGTYQQFFDGIIDEVRLSNISRSADWISTSYNNQDDPSSFYSVGGEERIGENSVALNSPLGETVTSWTVDFDFTPTFYETIQNASLYTNETGSWQIEETIYSVTANQSNIISHTFPHTFPYPEEGTYLWNVEVWNSTRGFFASSNSSVTIDVPPRYRNVASNTTTPTENSSVLLHGEAYDGIGLDWAWLWTNETGGTGKNYTILETECSGNGTQTIIDSGTSVYQRGILYQGKLYDTEGGALVIRNWTTGEIIASHTFASGFSNTAPELDYSNEEIVYAASRYGEVICYNTTSKTEVWSRTFSVSETTVDIDANTLGLDEGHLFVLLMNFTIFKLDKTDGSTVDTFVLDYYSSPSTGSKMMTVDEDNNRIYAVGYSKLHAINLTDMTEIWHVDLPTGAGDDGRSVPTVINDTSYSIQLGLMNHDITYNFDFDGNQNWNATIDGGVRAVCSYSPKTKYVYIIDCYSYGGTVTNHLYAFNVTSGEQMWKITAPRNDKFFRPLTIVGDYGLFHTNNRTFTGAQDYLYVYNMTDGSYIGEVGYTYPSSEPLVCYPIIVSGGKAVCGGHSVLFEFDLGIGEYVDYKYLYGNNKYNYIDECALKCYGKQISTKSKYYDSPMNMSGVADTWTWSNFTWSNSSITAGTTIQWRIYYNDTYGNVAATGIHTFRVRQFTEPIVSDPAPSNGATDVSISLTQLSFTLTEPQGELMDYYVTTSPNIGSDSATGVSDGTYTVFVGGLAYNTTYAWQVKVTDGTYWANVTYIFTTRHAWWNLNWLYRKTITIDHSLVCDDLTDFPVLIDITDSDLASNAQSSGDDIVFTDYSGSKLDHEIELYSGGHLVALVRVPSLSSTEETVLYMYYGNLGASNQENPTGVWDSHYVLVQHLEETSGTHYDSTSNNNDGTYYGSKQDATGKIDGADEFDGVKGGSVNDYVDIGTDSSLDVYGPNQDFTIFLWVKRDNLTTVDGFFSSGSSSDEGIVLGACYLDENDIKFMSKDNTVEVWSSNDCVGDYDWHLLVVTGDRDGYLTLYADGVAVNTTDISAHSSENWNRMDDTYKIGTDRSENNPFNGILDEVRISDMVRSACWVSTSYNNQHNPSGFYNVGPQEMKPAKIYIDPPLIEKTTDDVCTTFIVDVTIQNVTDLWGFDFNLTWNNALITLVNVEFNATLDNIWGPGNWFVGESMNVTGVGYYELAAVSTSTGFTSTEATGLATLQFHVEDAPRGQTPIHFAMVKLSNSKWQSIPVEATDGTYKITDKPTLQINPTNVTCRKYCENFTLTINVTKAYNVTDFQFEIHYNTTLLDYVNMTWNVWGSGTTTVHEPDGNVTGYASGTPITGNVTLVMVTFHASYYHIWKDLPNWTNNLTGTIYIQWANLSYPDIPDLHYEKGGLNDINVNPVEVVYTFASIQGDVDNDGDVDIMDLRTVAAFYDVVNDEYNLTGDSTIDIYDLVAVAANYNYKYDC